MSSISCGSSCDRLSAYLHLGNPEQEINRPLLLRLVSHRMQAKDLDIILDTLEQSNRIVIYGAGNKQKYEYKDDNMIKKKEKGFTDTILDEGN